MQLLRQPSGEFGKQEWQLGLAGEPFAAGSLQFSMGQEVVIYHNPRCSKSRQALALLNERGIRPRVVRYLETPPDAQAIAGLLSKLGLEPRDLMRKREAPYAALGLAAQSLSRDELIQALADHPALIERPILVAGERAVIGRPPEKALEIL